MKRVDPELCASLSASWQRECGLARISREERFDNQYIDEYLRISAAGINPSRRTVLRNLGTDVSAYRFEDVERATRKAKERLSVQ
ncbi:hypothetical protein [Pararobbsia silviterrae]|uniref:hypothetical protein n=1 Tax=Pararobbsia silviterrae TaxID=1792498 RepID=UPI001313EFC2|nr:hypothetical protein [Pararobbsia silviterrae]